MSSSFCDCVNQWEKAVGLQVLKDTKYLSLRTRGGESASRCFQPGEGPSRGLHRDCENRLWNRWITTQHYMRWYSAPWVVRPLHAPTNTTLKKNWFCKCKFHLHKTFLRGAKSINKQFLTRRVAIQNLKLQTVKRNAGLQGSRHTAVDWQAEAGIRRDIIYHIYHNFIIRIIYDSSVLWL